MNPIVEAFNAWSSYWWQWLAPATCQSAAVALILLVLVTIGRRWAAPVRHALLLVALLKFAMPPTFWSPTGIFYAAATPFSAVREQVTLPSPRVAPGAHRSDSRIGAFASTSQAAETPHPNGPAFARAMPAGEVALARESFSPYAGHRYTWRTWLMLLHALGSALTGAWILRQHRIIRRVKQGALRVSAGELHKQLTLVASRIGVRDLPQLLVSTQARSPMAFGILRPSIMLPAVALRAWSESERRTILAHELAHFRRRDLWINGLQMGLSIIWWFHPFFWGVNRCVRKVREDCCDDLLLARQVTSSDAYCEVLLRAARDLASPVPNPVALGFGEQVHPLERRLARIMDDGVRRSAKLSVAGVLTIMMAASLLLPGVRGEPGALTPIPTNAAAVGARDPSLGILPHAWRRRLHATPRKTPVAPTQAELAALIAELQSDAPDTVSAATRNLEELGFYALDAVPALLESVARGNEPGVVALVRIAPASTDVAAGLVKMLGDQHEPINVRTAIARWIGELKLQRETLEPALLLAFDQADARLQQKIAWSLQNLGATSAAAEAAVRRAGGGIDRWETEFSGCTVAQLIECIRQPRMRFEDMDAAQYLGKSGPAAREAVPALIEMLNDKTRLARGVAVQTLAAIGPDAIAAVPALVEYLRGGERPYCHLVPYAFSRICVVEKHSAAVGALIEAIDNPMLQNVAVTVLGQFGRAAGAAVPRLSRLFRSDRLEDQVQAARALSRIDPDRAPALVQFWIKILQAAPDHAGDAVEALGVIGQPAAPAMTLLNAIVTNPEQPAHLREQAAESLTKIRNQTGLF